MGETYVTIQGNLDNDDAKAKRQVVAIREFFDECKDAYNFWQDNRDCETRFFWREMKRRFPQAEAFMSWRHCGDHTSLSPLNGITGELSWADACTRRRFDSNDFMFQYVTECWSCAEIRPIAVYLMAKFKLRYTVSYYKKAPRLNAKPETWKKFHAMKD